LLQAAQARWRVASAKLYAGWCVRSEQQSQRACGPLWFRLPSGSPNPRIPSIQPGSQLFWSAATCQNLSPHSISGSLFVRLLRLSRGRNWLPLLITPIQHLGLASEPTPRYIYRPRSDTS